MRRRQELEREAAAMLMSKKAGDGGGSTQRLDELTVTSGRMTTRQNTADDRNGSKTDLVDKQKLRSVLHSPPLWLTTSVYFTGLYKRDKDHLWTGGAVLCDRVVMWCDLNKLICWLSDIINIIKSRSNLSCLLLMFPQQLLPLLKWVLVPIFSARCHFDKGSRCCRNVNNKQERLDLDLIILIIMWCGTSTNSVYFPTVFI